MKEVMRKIQQNSLKSSQLSIDIKNEMGMVSIQTEPLGPVLLQQARVLHDAALEGSDDHEVKGLLPRVEDAVLTYCRIQFKLDISSI